MDLTDIDRLYNITQNILFIDNKITNMKSILDKKTKTEFHMNILNNLNKKSERLTSWDYQADHGFKNLLDKVNTLIEIIKIQDYKLKEKDRQIEDISLRITNLENS